MAKDAQLAAKQLGLDRLTPRRGDMVNFGDQEPMVFDERTDDGSFDRFFPNARRIGIA